MVGVALARAGAAHIVCTDGDLRTLANCRLNLWLNGLQPASNRAAAATQRLGKPGPGAVECRQLLWEEGAGPQAPDVVLGADLLYDPDAIPALLALIKQLLVAGSSRNSRGSSCSSRGQPPSPASCPVGASGVQACDSGGADCGCRRPMVLLATMRRNEATLAAFLVAVAADPELELSEVPAAAVAAVATAADTAAVADHGLELTEVPAAVAADAAGQHSGAQLPRAALRAQEGPRHAGWWPGGVRFHHHSALEAARDRILLHRLQLAPAFMTARA